MFCFTPNIGLNSHNKLYVRIFALSSHKNLEDHFMNRVIVSFFALLAAAPLAAQVFSQSLMLLQRQTENLSRKLRLNVKNGFVQVLTMLSFGRLRLKKNRLTKPSIVRTQSVFTNG